MDRIKGVVVVVVVVVVSVTHAPKSILYSDELKQYGCYATL